MPAKKYATKEERRAAKNARRRTPEARAKRNAREAMRRAADPEYDAKRKEQQRGSYRRMEEAHPGYGAAASRKHRAKRLPQPPEARDRKRESNRECARRRRLADPEKCRADRRAWYLVARQCPVRRAVACQRSRISRSLKGGVKSESSESLIGCTISVFKAHLESLWLPGMSWDNYAHDGWHVDHIRPLASFDLTDPAQQKAAFHYTNCQPLWASENLSKSAKWEAA